MKTYHIYFKSDSCDDYHFHIQAESKPSRKKVLNWLFKVQEVDGGIECWPDYEDKIEDIPYCSLDIIEVEMSEFK